RKTRASRSDSIRPDKAVGAGELVVTDFLKPDLDELYGVLPYRLVAPFARWAERRWPNGRPTIGQHVKTTTVSGFLRVWMLTWLRPLRPISYRAREEHARIDRWLSAVTLCATWDNALACEVGRAAQLVKGYGDVRRRMVGHFDRPIVSVSSEAAKCAFMPDTPTSISVPSCSRPLYSQRRAGSVRRARVERRFSGRRSSSATRLIACGSRKVKTSFSRSSWTGLPMKSAAPSFKHSRAWLSLTTPETATIGTPSARTGRSWRKSSPLIPGSWTSRRIASSRSVFSVDSAASAVWTTRGW